jgi:large subunit ribosomal protein L10
MDREQKAAAVAELTEDLKGAESIFAIDYRGISVTEAAELRGRLAEADAVFKVVKNRLAKRAAADAGTEGVGDLLIGPTALTLIKGDAVIAAKAIATFTKEHEVLTYKGGLMDGEPLDPDSFAVIARLPGLEVLHGQLVGLTASPLTGLVTGLGAMVSGLAIALGQIAEQGLVSGAEPAAEPEPGPAEPEPAATEEQPAAGEEEEAPAAADEPSPDEPSGDEPPADEPPAEEPSRDEPPADEPPADEQTSAEPDEASQASDDNQAESSEESEPEGAESEEADSETTTEEE